jgi:hypothetical protein
MTFDEVKSLKDLGDSPYSIKSRSLFKDGYINVNHRIALAVSEVASYFDTSADISIYDNTGNEIGVLCFTKERGITNWRTLTENQFIAFLSEASFHDREDDYIFEYNYVVLNDSFYDDYIQSFIDSSALWGGFIHPSGLNMTNHKRIITRINLQELVLGNDLFKENSKRAVLQPFAHERFLKLYHLLELRFDVDIVQQIQNLDFSLYPEKIGKILGDYSHTEFPRLKSIIDNNCSDITPLVSAMNGVVAYQDIARDIFYKFGKTTNPLAEEADFTNVVVFGFEEPNLRAQSISYQRNYNKFIKHLASYWIYRIRCCIAHNKIGEYILTHDNEDFIADFAEPLIKEVIRQSFKP